MPDRCPPLTALRAFEAAARHLSFAKAAEELGVTPAALSFQIRSLEARLGVAVFRRLNRAVELTEAGRVLAPGARDGFDSLSRAWQSARRLAESRTLTVAADPAFTARWLAPRLYDFASLHPDIDLRLAVTLRPIDPERDGVDVAVRFGEPPEGDVFAELLLRDFVTPMMHPALATEFAAPADLAGARLLHQDDLRVLNAPVDWPGWFRAAEVETAIDRDGGVRFERSDQALEAAIHGEGVALGRAALAAEDISAGRLVAPFDPGIALPAAFRLVCRAGAETRPAIAAFREWILDVVGQTPDLRSGRRLVETSDIPPAAVGTAPRA